jgi:hypothetical protein
MGNARLKVANFGNSGVLQGFLGRLIGRFPTTLDLIQAIRELTGIVCHALNFAI